MGGTVDSHLFALNMFTKLSHSISSQLAISPELAIKDAKIFKR